MCVLIAINNWVIGFTGNWYSISVIILTIGIFNLEQAAQYFCHYQAGITRNSAASLCHGFHDIELFGR